MSKSNNDFCINLNTFKNNMKPKTYIPYLSKLNFHEKDLVKQKNEPNHRLFFCTLVNLNLHITLFKSKNLSIQLNVHSFKSNYNLWVKLSFETTPIFGDVVSYFHRVHDLKQCRCVLARTYKAVVIKTKYWLQVKQNIN